MRLTSLCLPAMPKASLVGTGFADTYGASSATAQIHWATFTIDQTCANFIGKRTDLLLSTTQTQLLTLYLHKHNKILTQ